MLNNRDNQKDLSSLINEIKGDLLGYINNRLNYYKLRTYEKMSMGGSFIAYALIISVLFFTIFMLILLTLGFFLGELLNSNAAGFGLLILITLLILGLCTLNAKRIRRTVANLIISLIKKIETDEE